ncbi:MAG: hypothetical protein D6760_10725 [Deltaproteobacteria bacterium]|nr:MAG: hypothetical protein D6760_10725 [Deltaproteobacteria bacterium]
MKPLVVSLSYPCCDQRGAALRAAETSLCTLHEPAGGDTERYRPAATSCCAISRSLRAGGRIGNERPKSTR